LADPSIVFRAGDRPGVRCMSGHIMLDEAFLNGRLCTRYWNANGQIWPEMHFESRRWNADQPADAFRLGINGQDLSGGFAWESAVCEAADAGYRRRRSPAGKLLPVAHGVVTLDHKEASMRVRVHTRLDGGPFIIRWLEITNTNREAVGITEVAPFSGLLWTHRYEEHLPAGSTSPFELAYNHTFEWGREGDFWFEPLPDGRKVVNGEKKGRSGWGRPAFWARNNCNGETFVCELAWGGNYEFGLDCRLKDTNWGWQQVQPASQVAELYFRMGLSGVDNVLRVLDPGETIRTPAVHLALFHEDTDAIVQATHDHVRHVVLPARVPGRHVEIEANHRGYLCDRENVTDIQKDIDVAASIGAELYVIDAGWYGNEPNQWFNNTGDWFDGKWMKNGGGLKAVVVHAHKRGMKFGLWVEIEAAGNNSTLRKDHPGWLLARDGQPIAGGRALDLTQPAVAKWVEGEIRRLIRTRKLDMYRIDHNHCMAPFGNRKYKGFTEDLAWRYYDNFSAMFARLRKEFPKVVFQNCAGGGGRLDWGTMSQFHNTELSDWMRMPRGVKILSGVSLSLPPEVLLRTFGTEVGEHVLDGDVDTQLRHCFCRLIFRGIAPTMDELSPYLRERVEHYLDLYRRVIRPVMADGLVFHHTPFLPLNEPTPWCVLEYADRNARRSVAALFRTSAAEPGEFVFKPRGVNPAFDYRVTLDNSGRSFRIPGRELMQAGLTVRLESTLRSELIVLEQGRWTDRL